jgi:DNA polymerase III sliding clamp (beta) subunit (PCNA family)
MLQAFTVTKKSARFGYVLLHAETTALHVVATDSYRLVKIDIPITCQTEARVCIPESVVNLLSQFHGVVSKNTLVKFNVDIHNVWIETTTMTIVTPMTDDQFPDYERITDYSSREYAISLFGPSLLGSLQRVYRFLKGWKHELGVQLDIGKEEIKISSQYTTTEHVPIVGGSFETTVIMNSLYLIQALKPISDSNITIKFSDIPFIPISIHAENYQHVIMPLREM